MKQKLLKSMLLLCILVLGGVGNLWATDGTLILSSSNKFGTVSGSTKNDDQGNTWTCVGSNIQSSYQSTYSGQQFGTSTTNNTYTFTANFSGKIVTGVSIIAAAGNTTPTYDISVGGSSKKSGSLSKTATTYSTGTISGTGDVVITLNQNSGKKAVYLGKIVVSYTQSGGGSEPSISLTSNTIEATEAAKEGTVIVTYNNLTDYASDVVFVGSDGTTSAEYDWLGAEINATDNTKLDYTIDANTGAARTAYMRVYVVDNTLGELYSPVITVTQAAKTVDAPVINLASNGNYLVGTGLTLTSAGNAIYYNMTTDGSDPADPTTSSTLYTGPIAISSGTLKIKSVAYDAYGNKSGFASRTVNGITPTTLPFNWAGGGGKDTFTALPGVVGAGLGSDYTGASYGDYKIKFDHDGDYILIFTNEQPVKVCVGALLNGNSTSSIIIQESTNGSAFTDVQTFSISGKQYDVTNIETTNAFTSTTRVVKILFVKSGSNVGVGPITINLEKATLNASGYATFAANVPLDFSDDSEFSAWQITGVNGTAITFSQITGTVAAGTGVLLKGTASATVNIPVAASGTDISSTNKLTGITTATDVTAGKYFGLSGNKFVKVNAGTVPAGKALLPVSAVGAGVKEFTFNFGGDDVDGINSLTPALSEGEGVVYDLSGRKVNSQLEKGIYIVNGKKILF